MFRLCVLAALVGVICGQSYRGDPQTAAILNEQRYLSGDGKFGSQYSQEDGVQFKEESEADGTRRGTYSYVDPNGQRHTVSYTAGKNGFQASGDGIPQPLPTTLPVAPQPQYQPQPQYNPPPQYDKPQSQYRPKAKYQPQSQYEPQSQYQPQPQYQSQPQYQPQPQYKAQPQYQSQPQYQPQQYRPQPQYTTTPAPHRFYPPGKLSLNRSPDGFSYSFQQS